MKRKAKTQAKENLKKLQQEGVTEILHHGVLPFPFSGLTLVSVQAETEKAMQSESQDGCNKK